MDQTQINQLGDELYQAMLKREAVSPLTSRGFDISIDDAYHISLRMLQNRLDAGERVIGKKIGVTSKAVQNMLNVHQPDFGYLTDAMVYNSGEAMPISEKLMQVIRGELLAIRYEYGDPEGLDSGDGKEGSKGSRRTELCEAEGEIEPIDLVADDSMVVMLTRNGYIKRLPSEEYRVQARGGKGVKGGKGRDDDDFVTVIFEPPGGGAVGVNLPVSTMSSTCLPSSVSCSSRALAMRSSLSRLSLMSFLANWYPSSINRRTSASICWAVCSL